MIQFIPRRDFEGEERYLILEKWDEDDADETWSLRVNANHYSRDQRLVEHAEYRTLDEAQADCLERFGVPVNAWSSPEDVTHEHRFTFQYWVTNSGVPQPWPLGFPHAEICFHLGEVGDGDGGAAPMITICGNENGLRGLAAYLLLCADSARFEDSFHVHLDRDGEPKDQYDPTLFLSGNIDATLRAPGYLEAFREGTFREWRIACGSDDEDESEAWKRGNDASAD